MDQCEFDKLLKQIAELQQELNASKKYGLVWDKDKIKENSVQECSKRIPILLREDTKDINDGLPNNVLIEGDNFNVLTTLNSSLEGKIDVIYIDPPYNTGHEDFSYNDKFVDGEDNYRHSKWLSFMQKRLTLAKRLLSDDGVIFISIDDNEQANLRILCNSIFGETNFITQFVWEKTQHFGRQKINYYSNCEYVLCYAKKLFSSELGKLKELLVEKVKTDLTDAPLYNASNRENELHFKPGVVKFNLKDGIYSEGENRSYILVAPVSVKNGVNENELVLRFKSRWSQSTINEETKKGTTFWVKSKGFAIRAIYHEGKSANDSPKQLIFTNSNNPLCAYTKFGTKVGVNEEGSNDLSRIMSQTIFSYPKPVSLIKYLISLSFLYKENRPSNSAIVLDFFAGSGTTGQAVLELNKEDGGNRRFILCTNNENNICTDVTYPRLKTVITGIRPDGSKYSDGIPSNLYYFKTGFVEDLKNSDQTKYNLAEKVDSLLCIKEDIFDEKERNEYSSHFVSSDKKRHLFIYNDYFNKEKFDEFKERVIKAEGEKVVYVFSFDNNLDESLFDDKSINVKPIPEKIYEIYKEIAESIKRGE